jgi:hypothetical protein
MLTMLRGLFQSCSPSEKDSLGLEPRRPAGRSRAIAAGRCGGHRAESLAGGCVGKQAAAAGAHAGGGRDGRLRRSSVNRHQAATTGEACGRRRGWLQLACSGALLPGGQVVLLQGPSSSSTPPLL